MLPFFGILFWFGCICVCVCGWMLYGVARAVQKHTQWDESHISTPVRKKPGRFFCPQLMMSATPLTVSLLKQRQFICRWGGAGSSSTGGQHSWHPIPVSHVSFICFGLRRSLQEIKQEEARGQLIKAPFLGCRLPYVSSLSQYVEGCEGWGVDSSPLLKSHKSAWYESSQQRY